MYHEALHPNVARPAEFHRCYDEALQRELMSIPPVQHIVATWLSEAESGPVVDFGWTTQGLVPALFRKLGSQFRVLVLYRHPVNVAASMTGQYSVNTSPAWAITPWHSRVRYPSFQDRWHRMSPFEKGLYRWLEITAYGLELTDLYPSLDCLVVKSEDLYQIPSTTREIASFCGFPSAESDLVRSNERHSIEAARIERSPLGRHESGSRFGSTRRSSP